MSSSIFSQPRAPFLLLPQAPRHKVRGEGGGAQRAPTEQSMEAVLEKRDGIFKGMRRPRILGELRTSLNLFYFSHVIVILWAAAHAPLLDPANSVRACSFEHTSPRERSSYSIRVLHQIMFADDNRPKHFSF